MGVGDLDNDPTPLDSCSAVYLSWEASSDEGGSGIEGYFVELEYYEDGEGIWDPVGSSSLIEKTAVEVTEWLIEGRHRWRVWARDNAGNESDPSDWLYFVCPTGVLPAPDAFNPGWYDPGDAPWESCPLLFEWSEIGDPGEVTYEIEVYRDADGTWVLSESRGEIEDIVWEVSEGDVCENPGDYRWRVRAVDGDGEGAGTPGEWSEWLYYVIPTDS
jgi:hypothetical protein